MRAFGRLRGIQIEDIDRLVGGAAHNLSQPDVCGQLLSRAWRAEFGALFIGPPCSSYSPALRASGLFLRSRCHPKGRHDAPPGWRSYIRRHNGFGSLALQLAWAQHHTGGGWAIEQPADTGVEGTPWHWQFAADCGSLWLWPEIQELQRQTGARFFTFAQCMFGAVGRKYTTILASPSIAKHLMALDGVCCPGVGWHRKHVRAFGTDELGGSRAAQAAAYPAEMNRLIATAMAAAAAEQLAGRAAWRIGRRVQAATEWTEGLFARLQREQWRAREGFSSSRAAEAPDSDDSGSESGDSVSDASSVDEGPTADEEAGSGAQGHPQQGTSAGLATGQYSAQARAKGVGGRVADGCTLTSDVRAVCELAATAPAAFASQRNRRAAGKDELRVAELPTPQAAAATFVHASAAQPPTGRATSWDGRGEWRRIIPGGEECPDGDIAIQELFLPTVYERVQEWIRLAEAAMRQIFAGGRAVGPEELTIPQQDLQPWARGIVWDCRDPHRCVPVARSSRDTVFPGKPSGQPSRQIDRVAFRQAAGELGWERVDPDIVAQVGEGGVEARTTCSLDMVLGFHHRGVLECTEAAKKVIAGDLAEGWVSSPVAWTPFVPCRCLPRNVVQQHKQRVGVDGVVEAYLKHRVSQNSSFGRSSPNSGVPHVGRTVTLPTVQAHGRAHATIDLAVGGGAVPYGIDAEAAFRFLPIQVEDVWTQCFFWLDEATGEAGVCVDGRLGFGGAFGPNRFERVSLMACAYILAAQDRFDDAHPQWVDPEWRLVRRTAQRSGVLTAGGDQLRPRTLSPFIDDLNGSAAADIVEVSKASEWDSLRAIGFGQRNSLAPASIPPHPDSRVAWHVRLAITGMRRLGMSVSDSKTQCGSVVVELGLRFDTDTYQLSCPEGKREVMRSDLARLEDGIAQQTSVERKLCETLAGRAGNLAQVFPEWRAALYPLYAISKARKRTTVEVGWADRAAGRRQPLVRRIPVRKGGRWHHELTDFIGIARASLDTDEGVQLAPSSRFPALGSEGVVSSITDASGDDGVGGYLFHPAAPGIVWLVSEDWPKDVKAALKAAAAVRAEREKGDQKLAMPAAELFGCWAIPQAVKAWRSEDGQSAPEWDAVIAIGDCAPAARALNLETSASAQMRVILREARRGNRHWLGVAVPREWNLDADRLSHPVQLRDVWEDTVRSGLRPERARITEAMWDILRAALEFPLASEDNGGE